MRNSSVGVFLLGQFLSIYAGLFGWSVLIWHIVSAYGTAAVVEVSIFQAGIYLGAFFLLSPLGDRYDRTFVLKGLTWLTALRALLLAGCVTLGLGSVPLFIAIQVLNVIAMGVIIPVQNTVLSDLLPSDQLPEAIATQNTVASFARLAGPASAGVALTAMTVVPCLWLATALSVLACFCNTMLPSLKSHRDPINARLRLGGFWTAWRIRARLPLERHLGWVGMITVGSSLPALVMLVPIRIHQEGWDRLWLGLTESALVVGALLANIGVGRLVIDYLGRYRTFLFCTLLQGVALLLAGIAQGPYQFALCYLIQAMMGTMTIMASAAHRLLAMPKGLRTRVNASKASTAMVAALIGTSLTGWAVQTFHVVNVEILLGALVALASLGIASAPRLRVLLSLSAQDAELWYEREYGAVFKDYAQSASGN